MPNGVAPGTPPPPSTMQQVMNQAGFVSGMYGLGVTLTSGGGFSTTIAGISAAFSKFGLKAIRPAFNAILNTPALKHAFGVIAIALSAYSMYNTVLSMFRSGFSLMGMAQLGMAWFGAY